MKRSVLATFLVRQQIGYRLGAVLLASLLWVFIVSLNDYSWVIDLPIEIRNIHARKALSQEIPRTAQVRFKGSGRTLFKTVLLKNVYDLKLVVDLERIRTQYDFNLNDYFEQYPDKVAVPGSFQLEFIEIVFPDSLHIRLDDYMTKTVPVISRVKLDPAPGYLLVGDPQLQPGEVEIAGPKDQVENITRIYTRVDTLSAVNVSVRRSLALEPLGRLIEQSHQEIVYRADIQAISDRIVSEIPVRVVNVLPNLRVFVNPRTVSLTITGGVEVIAATRPEDIAVTIDFSRQWNPKQQFYEPAVVVPGGIIEWRDLSPRNLELVVTREAG